MAIAKVILNGVTQMDVTQKTVTAGSMLSGTTALKNDGTDITGSIASKTSSDMTVSGATVTAPAGYYASAASKSVASGSATTPATTITANPTVSVNSSGLITATVSKTQSVTPSVSAGYVSSGTAGTITVSGSGTSQLTTQAAQTIHPSTTDQTIASGKYLTGAQTIKAVTTTNLTAANIVQGVTVKIGDSTDDDCVASVTGTAETGGNDFVITLTQNASTGVWTPDCTFAEAQAAYNGGKNIVFVADGEFSAVARWDYYPTVSPNYAFEYTVVSPDSEDGLNSTIYTWTASSITSESGGTFYFTAEATAVPADVASGKVFYNANGYQVGTASGGGGGGISGVAKGTLTVASTVSTSTSVDIATTTEIGFTPTKFFFYKDTNTGTDAVIYMSTYADIGSKYIRVRAVYDARNAMASVSGNYMNWTSSSSGYLYFASNTVKISVSSSYKLEAGTYTWLAVL